MRKLKQQMRLFYRSSSRLVSFGEINAAIPSWCEAVTQFTPIRHVLVLIVTNVRKHIAYSKFISTYCYSNNAKFAQYNIVSIANKYIESALIMFNIGLNSSNVFDS